MPLVSVFIATVESGEYISLPKVVPCLLLTLLWARLLTWIDKDSRAILLPREMINLGMVGGLILAYLVLFFLPFAIGFSAFVVIFLADIGIYLGMRSQKAGLGDLKNELKGFFGREKTEKVVSVSEGQVAILGKGGKVLAPPSVESEDAVGYGAVQRLLGDPLQKNAERIELQSGEGAAQVRCVVDGVTYAAPPMDLASGAEAIKYLKGVANLDLNDRRKPQSGIVRVSMNNTRHELEITTAGSSSGEFLRVVVNPQKRHLFKLDDLGFSDDQLNKIKASIADNKGIVLIAAPKGAGLTSMLYAILRGHDAFVQHIQTVERNPDLNLEGITQNKLPAGAPPGEETKKVSWVASNEPDVLLVDQIDDPRTAHEIIKFTGLGEGKRAYVGIRAGSTFEAMRVWRKLVGDERLAMSRLTLVVAGRVFRRLCMACKLGFAPDPNTLRKLNIHLDTGASLFQARTEPMRDAKGNPVPCEFCKELRDAGRLGAYEVLQVEDDVRAIVQGGGSDTQIAAALRKQHGKLLQEMALAQIEKGETSVQEMVRVMKGEPSPPAPAKAATTAPGARPVAKPPVKK